MIEKKFSIILICVLLVAVCVAQENQDETELLPEPVCLDGKSVYINRFGKVILQTPFQYKMFANDAFSEGLAGFVENGKYGFIDETGKVVIKPSFDYIGKFSEGLAEIQINEKAGFVDKTGKIIVEPQYHFVSPFTNGFSLVRVEDGPDKKNILGIIFRVAEMTYKYGFLDKTGEIAVGKTKNKHIGKFDDADDFSEGLAPVKIDGKWGYVNEEEKMVIKRQFKEAKSFSEGLASATVDGENWGFIDKTGKFVIKPQFTDAEGFSEGLAAISTSKNGWGDWGFIDKSGNIVIKPTFFGVGNFHEGMVWLFFGRDGFGYADRTGKVVIEKLYSVSNFKNGIAAVSLPLFGKKFIRYGTSYIDKTGNFIWNAIEKNKMFTSSCDN